MRVAGVDEAGRGPILGPMVLAGVMLDEKELRKLRRLGVRDSKKLTPEERTKLAAKIRTLPGVVIVENIAWPFEIDEAVADRSRTLNGLEIERMARIIDELGPDEAYIDLIGHSSEKFIARLFDHMDRRPRVVAEHRADDRYPIVAAASIIAKVRRDAEIARLEAICSPLFGTIGSGYCHDPRTRALVRSGHPIGALKRASWITREAEATSPELN